MDDFAGGSRKPKELPPHLRIVRNDFLKPATQTARKDPAKLSGYRGDEFGRTAAPEDDWE